MFDYQRLSLLANAQMKSFGPDTDSNAFPEQILHSGH